MNRKQHKWAGFRAPKLRICTPDIIDHIVLHRRHSPPKTSSTDTIRSGRACQKPLLPASSPPKSDDQNSQKSFNNSQLGPGIPSMSTFCGQFSLEKNFLIVRSQVFRTFQVTRQICHLGPLPNSIVPCPRKLTYRVFSNKFLNVHERFTNRCTARLNRHICLQIG